MDTKILARKLHGLNHFPHSSHDPANMSTAECDAQDALNDAIRPDGLYVAWNTQAMQYCLLETKINLERAYDMPLSTRYEEALLCYVLETGQSLLSASVEEMGRRLGKSIAEIKAFHAQRVCTACGHVAGFNAECPQCEQDYGLE